MSGTISSGLCRATNAEWPTPGRFGAMIRNPARRRRLGDVRPLVMRANQTVEEEDGVPAAVAVFVDLELHAPPSL